MTTAPTIQRPHYGCMSVADALRADWQGWHLSRKMDGVFAVREFSGCVVTGEQMKGGTFYPFDIATAFGADVRPLPWTERSAALNELLAMVPERLNWHRIATGHGSEFIEAMIHAARNDGSPDVCVVKPLAAPFGVGSTKIKLVETFDCTVSDTGDGRLSIGLSYQGQAAGRCPVRDLAILDSLHVGDCVEVAGTLTAQGRIREPRFIRARPDKEFGS